jgi:hypothetical protein
MKEKKIKEYEKNKYELREEKEVLHKRYLEIATLQKDEQEKDE